MRNNQPGYVPMRGVPLEPTLLPGLGGHKWITYRRTRASVCVCVCLCVCLSVSMCV